VSLPARADPRSDEYDATYDVCADRPCALARWPTTPSAASDQHGALRGEPGLPEPLGRVPVGPGQRRAARPEPGRAGGGPRGARACGRGPLRPGAGRGDDDHDERPRPRPRPRPSPRPSRRASTDADAPAEPSAPAEPPAPSAPRRATRARARARGVTLTRPASSPALLRSEEKGDVVVGLTLSRLSRKTVRTQVKRPVFLTPGGAHDRPRSMTRRAGAVLFCLVAVTAWAGRSRGQSSDEILAARGEVLGC